MTPPIHVIGIGEDGLSTLSAAARTLVETADVVVGGERHLAKIANPTARQMDWSNGFDATLDAIAKIRDEMGAKAVQVVVLASGDPLFFGAGTTLIKRFGAEHVCIHPTPGAVSLTCARMGWSQPDVTVVTLHGRSAHRHPATVALHLFDGACLIALSKDGTTPKDVADVLTAHGFGPSRMTVWEHLGGALENHVAGIAQDGFAPCADLNTVAIECRADETATPLSRRGGLPDAAFEHDGQLTKREVRAVTLSSLAPQPGQVLWDVGAGAGSVAIEWMRADRTCRAVAIERDPARAARIGRNALALGVPGLAVCQQDARDALSALEGAPDAVFVGGGVGTAGLVDVAWSRLKPGGRLVANAVTVEGEGVLRDMYARFGGDLLRLTVERAESVTPCATFMTAMRTVTHWCGVKP